MGGRDYRHRETTIAKKTTRPVSVKVEALVPSADVEIAKKRKPRREPEPSD